MRTKKTCCCCGNKPCKNNEYRYSSTQGSNCKICALGITTTSIEEVDAFAPYEPERNKGDGGWEGSDIGGDSHPDNLHVGNVCWHNGEEGWQYYPSECGEWNKCWNDYEDYGLSKPPESTFYQFDSPFGLLPWSPQAFNEWIQSWDGPLVPQGDCTMHCTEENIDCHTLAFVGAVGKNYGSMDVGDGMPLCGSDIVTVPPPQSEWEWVRQWVKRGGKLVIMGESSGSPNSTVPSCRDKLGFFTKDATYYTEQCDDAPNAPAEMSGEEVAEMLKEFAYYCARQDDELEPEEFFKFVDEEPSTENYINNFEAFVDEDGNETTYIRSCCQKSKRPFLKRDNPEDKMKPFAFQCSSSSGMIPKGKGNGLVGHCNGEGCTVVWKPNDQGAVVVVYDSDVWGASNAQVPMSWWGQEAQYPDNIELGLSASDLKLRSCNNDFWKFMCEEFLPDSTYSLASCGEPQWDWDIMMDPEKYKSSDNPCLKTAPCCLPNGECIDDLTVWECFEYEDENERLLPGIWHGSSEVHPNGVGDCDLTCGDVSCIENPTGVCCVGSPLGEWCASGFADTVNCCLSEDWQGKNVMYEYECCHIKEQFDEISETYWLEGVENCDECFIMGACCTGVDEECLFIRKIDCINLYGGEFQGEDEACSPNPCIIPVGACCIDESCSEEITESDCVAAVGEYQGDGTSCTPDPCAGDPIGACCFTNGSCSEFSEIQCNDNGGSWMGGETNCDSNPCGDRACCYGDVGCELCLDTNLDVCDDLGGILQAQGILCVNEPCENEGCPENACCQILEDVPSLGWCRNVPTISDCNVDGGEIFHEGISCDDLAVNEIYCTGSCCSLEAVCESGCGMVSEWWCNTQPVNGDGIWTGCDNCACEKNCPGVGDEVNCNKIGICCEDGICTDVRNTEECQTGYFKVATTCELEDERFCELGACCTEGAEGDECTDYVSEQCVKVGGNFIIGEECINKPCNALGACCFYSGDCQNLTEEECETLDGKFKQGELCDVGDCYCSCTWGAFDDCGSCCLDEFCHGYMTENSCDSTTFGAGLWFRCDNCNEGFNCPDPAYLGACCWCGDCFSDYLEDYCVADGGTWAGPGTDCIGPICPEATGCCCLPWGGQNNITESACISMGGGFGAPFGEWQGCGSLCGTNTCTGACCHLLNGCMINTYDVCWDLCEGDCPWMGYGSTCGPSTCWGSCCIPPDECTVYYTPYAQQCFYHGGTWMNHTPCSGQPECNQPLAPPPIPDCAQVCLDAGCECHCLNTNDGIVCL